MAKLMTMFLILIAIQGALIIYQSATPDQTELWQFITNIPLWSSAAFIVTLGGIAAALALSSGAQTGGGAIRFVTDFITFAAGIGGLISIGAVFTQLANLVNSEFAVRIFGFTGDPLGCAPSLFLTALLVGPIAFYYIWTAVEWWRGRDF